MGDFKDFNKPIQRLKNRLPKHAQTFIDECQFKRSPKTIYNYCKSLCLFYDYLSKMTSITVHDIDISVVNKLSTSDIKKFQDYISDGNNSIDSNRYHVPVGKSAVAGRTICLRQYFSFLKSSGILENDPTKYLLPYKPSKKEYKDRFIKEHDIQNLIDAISEAKSTSYHSKLASRMTVKRDIAIVLLLHNAGLFQKECANLNLSDVDLGKNSITIKRNGERIIISIDEKLKKALKEYIESERSTLLRGADDPALLISLKSARMNHESIRHMLHKYGKNIGMTEKLSCRNLYGEKKYEFYEQ